MTDQSTFAEDEKHFLRRLADVVISEAQELALPGAGDAQIFARFLTKASGREDRIRSAMTDFLERSGGIAAITPLDDEAFHDIAMEWQNISHPFLTRITSLIAQAYYEDPRVLRAYNKDARAPFPKGNDVAQGDWSLLDNVRGRPPIYRET
jgi:hypothetical protein